MASVYLSMCFVDVLWEVAQRIAVASRRVLCTNFALCSSVRFPDVFRLDSMRSSDTGISNSKHDLHSSAFSLPCVTSPMLAGGGRCHRGRVVAVMSSRITFKSCREMPIASNEFKVVCSSTLSCTMPSPMMSNEIDVLPLERDS